jgi:hypothetical protein
MERLLHALVTNAVLFVFAVSPAQAELQWATWVANGSSLANGSFTDGQTVGFSGYVAGIDEPAENGTATPAIPGEASGGNPPGVAAYTALPYPTAIMSPGDFVMAMDLGGIDAVDQVVFALSDLARVYEIELLDAASSPLSLSSVTLTNYNLTLVTQEIADFDTALNKTNGWLTLVFAHDGGGMYDHTGLATIANLHPLTRFIRITAASLGTQSTEGVHFYLATEVPEPTADTLGLAAFTALGIGATRARARRN